MYLKLSPRLAVVRAVLLFRLCRFYLGILYGADRIYRYLIDYHIRPLPSVRSIGRILRLLGLTRKSRRR